MLIIHINIINIHQNIKTHQHAGEKFFAEFSEGWLTFARYFFGASVAISTFGALLSITLSSSR